MEKNKVLTVAPLPWNHGNSEAVLFLTLVDDVMVSETISSTTDK